MDPLVRTCLLVGRVLRRAVVAYCGEASLTCRRAAGVRPPRPGPQRRRRGRLPGRGLGRRHVPGRRGRDRAGRRLAPARPGRRLPAGPPSRPRGAGRPGRRRLPRADRPRPGRRARARPRPARAGRLAGGPRARRRRGVPARAGRGGVAARAGVPASTWTPTRTARPRSTRWRRTRPTCSSRWPASAACSRFLGARAGLAGLSGRGHPVRPLRVDRAGVDLRLDRPGAPVDVRLGFDVDATSPALAWAGLEALARP